METGGIPPTGNMLKRNLSEIIACDYCHHHKCRWTEHTAGNPPGSCPGKAFFSITDTYLDKDEFRRRVDVARRIGRYNPGEKMWYLDPTREMSLTGYDLKRAVELEVNGWCGDNRLKLMDVIEYVEVGFQGDE